MYISKVSKLVTLTHCDIIRNNNSLFVLKFIKIACISGMWLLYFENEYFHVSFLMQLKSRHSYPKADLKI